MTTATLQGAVAALARLGCKPKQSGDEWIGYCPVHEADGKGHKPSLTLKAGDTVPVVVNCHAGCDGREILKALGMNGTARAKASIVATYPYQDESGAVVREKLRYEPKDFRIRHRDASGAWVYKAGPGPAVLYRLPEVTTAIAEGRTIFVCEGEKDCDRLAKSELVATTNIEGAAKPEQRPKWKREYTAQLAGAARVILLPDNDGPGRAHMATIAAQLAIQVGEVRVLELPGLPVKGDVSDWLNQGHTVDELKALARSASAEPSASPSNDAGKPAKPERESEPDGKAKEEEPGKTTRRRKGKRPDSEELAADLAADLVPKREGYICLRVGEYPEAVESAEQNLIEADVGIYQRGILCRVSRDPVPTVRGISRPAGVATIKEVTETWLLNQLDRRIEFEKWDGRSEDFKRCHAPKEIAQRLLHNAGSWKFPTLTGIITAPTLRPDGSILDQPGYDAATGLFFIQEQPFPTIPESPSKADGRAALDLILREVLAGFPFVEACHRSAALSAVLSVNVRHALRHTPLHAFTAPKAGSGKSLLADCVAMIGTGHPSAILALDDDQVEMNKAITAILMQGDAVVNLDNIERGEALSGRELSKALTQETYSGRILGSSKVVNLPSCCMWLATGNQLRISGDMTRRVIPCEIDPECERPDEREFKRDLYEWIPEHRPALVVAALTALRSYIVAGNPRQNIKPLGGFTDWSGLVRSALVWLGEEDPLSSRDSIEDADPERAKLRALLLAWQHTFGSAPATSKEAIFKATPRIDPQTRDEIIDAPELREVLLEFFKDRNGNINSRLLGECISQNARRIESGARFEIAGTSHGVNLWKVVITNPDQFEKASSVDSGWLGGLGWLVPNPARKLSVQLGSPSGNINSYIRRGAYGNDPPDHPNHPPTQKTPTEFPSRPAPTPPAAPSLGKPRPMACTWNGLGRLVTKCDDPEPNEDQTGCANCGASKPIAGE